MIQESHDPEGDWHVAEAAAYHATRKSFDLLFVYLGYTDSMGHDFGWMSKEYIAAISNADRCVEHILEAIKKTGRDVIALVGTDHGGHERSHGTEMEEDMTIPWILSGTGVPKVELNGQVHIYDTAPTLAAILNLPLPKDWDGRPIADALPRTIS
jgi:arylsulfatase A-like enzyme